MLMRCEGRSCHETVRMGSSPFCFPHFTTFQQTITHAKGARLGTVSPTKTKHGQK